MQDVAKRRTHDMYGHEIVPISNGFGVSMHFGIGLNGTVTPHFNIFHSSDGFRQSLFSVGGGGAKGDDRPQIENVFGDRLRGVLALLKREGPGVNASLLPVPTIMVESRGDR